MSRPHDHMVGVIPVAGFDSDFGFPWPACMQPIAKNYLAIERSVVECAYAGADTIWIVCNDDVQPLIRHRLGEYVQDPVWLYRKFDRHAYENKKPIPIFYAPINPKSRQDRLLWLECHAGRPHVLVGISSDKQMGCSQEILCFLSLWGIRSHVVERTPPRYRGKRFVLFISRRKDF
mgnify:CR=1 FL=1